MAGGHQTRPNGRIVELRVLDGPNLYFTRPAIKLTLELSRLAAVPEERLARRAEEAGLRSNTNTSADANGPAVNPGPPGSDRRLRFLSRLAAHCTPGAAGATNPPLAVRPRPASPPDRVVVAFPWRNRTAAETFARELAALLIDGLPGRRS